MWANVEYHLPVLTKAKPAIDGRFLDLRIGVLIID